MLLFNAEFRQTDQTIQAQFQENGKGFSTAFNNFQKVTEKGDQGLSAYEIAVKNGFEGTEEEWLESLHGTAFETDETLTLENGVLRVNTADEVEDNTLPITAAAVHTEVGNINVLLKTI